MKSSCDDHFGFPVHINLTIFHLHVNLLLHHKFPLNLLCSLQEDVQTDFQDCSCGGNVGFLVYTILAHLVKKLSCCYRASFDSNQQKVWEQMSKTDFKDSGCGAHLGFSIHSVLATLYFVSTRPHDAPHQVSTQLDHTGDVKNMNSQHFSHINV